MDIFLISRGYPEKGNPLWGIFEASQAKALRQRGHKVTMLSVDYRFRRRWRKIGVSHNKNGNVYTYFLFPFRLLSFIPGLPRKIERILYRKLYKKVIKKEGTPDIIYAHYLNIMSAALSIKKDFKGVMIGMEHWSELMKSDISKEVVERAKKTYHHYDRILGVSPKLCESIGMRFGIEAEFIPNIVDDEFLQAKKYHRESGSRFEFCSIGRLVDWKNFDILIKACALLENRGIDFGLTIIGNGDERPRLMKMIRDLELEDRITLAGTLNRAEVIENLSRSDAFVLPSQYETFGVVFIEAMALGLPVIAGNAGGPVDIVNKSNGMLVSLRDEQNLADAMEQMIRIRSKYDSEQIARECAEKYSSDSVSQKLEKVFAETLAAKRKDN